MGVGAVRTVSERIRLHFLCGHGRVNAPRSSLEYRIHITTPLRSLFEYWNEPAVLRWSGLRCLAEGRQTGWEIC